mmetsp:Transcript_10178/g.31399  ORF Transcript_10178/g.31399 Transcript_10178/m.31399 type:complete len:280 (-) Transcript_10178:73-912(-)
MRRASGTGATTSGGGRVRPVVVVVAHGERAPVPVARAPTGARGAHRVAVRRRVAGRARRRLVLRVRRVRRRRGRGRHGLVRTADGRGREARVARVEVAAAGAHRHARVLRRPVRLDRHARPRARRRRVGGAPELLLRGARPPLVLDDELLVALHLGEQGVEVEGDGVPLPEVTRELERRLRRVHRPRRRRRRGEGGLERAEAAVERRVARGDVGREGLEEGVRLGLEAVDLRDRLLRTLRRHLDRCCKQKEKGAGTLGKKTDEKRTETTKSAFSRSRGA